MMAMNTMDFIAILTPIAVADQYRSGVLASITMAQAILESASGRSAPGNNLFGIKGKGQNLETKEFVNGKWITIQDGFRVYDSWEGSVRDHSDFLLENSRYTRAGFFDSCKELDYKGAAQALQNAGYATDPQYASKLIRLIETFKLWKHDKEAKADMDGFLKRIIELENKAAQLSTIVRVLVETSAPDWFVKEFGAEILKDIVHVPSGDVNFWRNTAVTLRLIKRI
jgi:flagellum-specific peptidoglycan hydrolase FlgJ